MGGGPWARGRRAPAFGPAGRGRATDRECRGSRALAAAGGGRGAAEARPGGRAAGRGRRRRRAPGQPNRARGPRGRVAEGPGRRGNPGGGRTGSGSPGRRTPRPGSRGREAGAGKGPAPPGATGQLRGRAGAGDGDGLWCQRRATPPAARVRQRRDPILLAPIGTAAGRAGRALARLADRSNGTAPAGRVKRGRSVRAGARRGRRKPGPPARLPA